MEQAKVTICKQYFIDWASVGGYEKFIEDYKNAPDYEQRRFLVDSVMLQKNPEWIQARKGHITASNIKDFLTKGRAKNDLFGKGAQKVIRKYMAELLGWEEQDQKFSELFHVKRGLVFERRARELFKKETGLEIRTDIGFVSREINGIKFGCSPDGYILGEDTIQAYAEIKGFELQGFLEALEELASPDMQAQMQGQMMIADCPRCYAIWYCAELDKIVYLKYTRGLSFRKEIEDRIPLAIEYMKKIEVALKYTDLTDKIMKEEID